METLGASGFAFGTTAFALAIVALVQVRQLRKEVEAMRGDVPDSVDLLTV